MKPSAQGRPKSRGEKLLAYLWLSIPVVLLVTSAYGWHIGDLPGGLLLSFLPASLLVVIAVVVTTIVDSPESGYSRWIWVAIGVAALLASIIFANQPITDAPKGADTILAYVMLILSFPVALLVPFVLMVITPLWNSSGTVIRLSGMWITFFVAGYLQWFVLLPWLCRKRKARSQRREDPLRINKEGRP